MILRLILLLGLIDWSHGGFWPFLSVMVYRSPNWLTLLIIYLAWWGIQTFDCKRHQNALQGNCHLCGSCWSGALCACVGGSGRSWEIGVRAKGDVNKLTALNEQQEATISANTAAKRLRMRQDEYFRSLFQSHFPFRSKSPARVRIHSVCSL